MVKTYLNNTFLELFGSDTQKKESSDTVFLPSRPDIDADATLCNDFFLSYLELRRRTVAKPKAYSHARA